jgi:DNA-binding IclR family transcriptional regulator
MIQSLVRAIDILERLGHNGKKYSVAEIVEYTGLAPSTVHRILQTLVAKNLVAKEEISHLYYLGPGLIPLGIKASQHVNLRDVAVPVLEELSEYTGEDSYLITISGFKGLFLEKVEGKHPLKIVDTYGPEFDLHCGAIRKAILAFQDDEFIDEYIGRGLNGYTENTIVDPEKLRNNLTVIRGKGVSHSVGEYIKYAIGFGAPVRDKTGKVIAAIGIIAPDSRVEEEDIPRLEGSVKEFAEKISIGLGYNKSI